MLLCGLSYQLIGVNTQQTQMTISPLNILVDVLKKTKKGTTVPFHAQISYHQFLNINSD